MKNLLVLKNDSGDDDQDFIPPLELIKNVTPEKVQKSMSRREALSSLGLICGTGFLFGCGVSSLPSSGSGTSAATDTPTVSGSCGVIPSETEGPYPLFNARSSIYRQNIIGSDITDTTGVPLTIKLNIVNTNNGCAAISNAAVYVWHCDQNGEYSGYSSSQNGYHSGKTFCRGIQVSDNNGLVTFNTLYPGWYNGRITHVHLAVYLNNNLAATPKISQFGFQQAITQAVYAQSPYSSNGQNTSVTSFANDNVFSDGTTWQIASVTGNVSSGFVATLNIGFPA